MVDVVDKATRSRMMSGIRGKGTRPEIVVRKGLHALGFRYRLHDKKLPGKPDIVLPSYRAVILVHGCFWHGHDCHLFKWPSSNEQFWKTKINRNIEVDKFSRDSLHSDNWRIFTVWECALKGKYRKSAKIIVNVIATWLRSGSSDAEIKGEFVG